MTATNDSRLSPAQVPAHRAPRPTVLAPVLAFPAWTLCIECGDDYDPSDIPADLADIGRYHTCADCRAECLADMGRHAVGGWS